ncbi:hypothetical protein NM688_g4100 [Phlebia brevispora]|uniref:Uncharacterized protein n=1 Tax=Phlebia brevispora TaxID=194682 RepID=A0ACC1T3T5_9APHY|nr:hypothetical protein NM688_g4100 [Phlebia brevispora]
MAASASGSEDEPILKKGKPNRQKPGREDVNTNNILPDSTRRPRKASEKQKQLDEDDDEKQLRKYKKQYMEFKQRVKKKKTSDTAPGPSANDEDDFLDDPLESEDASDDPQCYVSPFQSKGVTDMSLKTKGKAKLLRRSQVATSHEATPSSPSPDDAVTLPPASPPVSLSSSRCSSLSERPASPINVDDSEDDSLPHQDANSVSQNTEHRSSSKGNLAPQQPTSNTASNSTKSARRPRSESSEGPHFGDGAPSQSKKVRRDKSANSASTANTSIAASSDPSTLVTIFYTTPDGKMPSKGKPNESDYPARERFLIKGALKIFLIKIYTVNGFPDDDVALAWAMGAWSEVCMQAKHEYRDEDSERIVKLIRNRAATARGHLRDEFRELIVPFFKIKADISSNDVRTANEARIRWLKNGDPPRFTYKKYGEKADDTPAYYAEARFLLRGLQKRIFKDANAIGSTSLTSFSPLPLPTIALCLTTVEFCLDAWASGEYNRDLRFEEGAYRIRYNAHLSQLIRWEALDAEVVKKLRQQMITRILQLGKIPGSTAEKPAVSHSKEAEARAREDLKGRTGQTDSEPE